MKNLRPRFLVPVVLWAILITAPGWYVVAAGEEEASVPVQFQQNKDIFLNLYPEGYRSAAVLAGVGIDGESNLYPLKRLIFLLANHGLRGTFFVFPGETFQEKVTSNPEDMERLPRLDSHNFEIAQNGPPPGDWERFEASAGSPKDIVSQRIDKIKENRDFLISLNLEPLGYRGYAQDQAGPILSSLDEMGYLYFCRINECSGTDRIVRSFPPASPEKTYLYPRHAAGLEILEFHALLDPTVDQEKARLSFEEISRQSGVFVFRLYLPGLLDKKNLGRLKEFIEYLKKRYTWICSLRQLSSWWLAREKVRIVTSREDNIMVIVYDNPTRFPLENARLVFKDQPDRASFYRVEDREGIMTSQGVIPAGGYINVTLFPVEPGSRKED